MKLEINCSHELLEKSKYCGTSTDNGCDVQSKCWIALAVQEVFPISNVSNETIAIRFREQKEAWAFDLLFLNLPIEAMVMIRRFDKISNTILTPKQVAAKRIERLKPFTFEIELTEEQEKILLENISLPDLTECFAKSKHLTLMV